MLQKEIFCDVKQTLESLNVCQRCILRFLGVKDYTCYVNESALKKAFQQLLGKHELEQELSEDISDLPLSKRHLPSICAACLGILQESCDKMISQIHQNICDSGHVFEDFVLQISIPVVVDLRDRLFLIYLKNKFGSSYEMKEAEIPTVKDAWKWVIGSSIGKITKTDFKHCSLFQICLQVIYPDTSKECLILLQKCPEAFPNRKKKKAKFEDIYTRTAIMKAMETLSSELEVLFPIPPASPDRSCNFEKVLCKHSALFLGGRYNKFSRELSQTPWVVDGERRMESSVNELITDVVQKHIICDKIIFSASGREDVDVKMLGNGRPFVLEILNPRRISWTLEEMKNIEKEINESTEAIAIRHLQVISKQDTLLLKEGEEQKRKTYSAVCIVEKNLAQSDIHQLNEIKDLVLKQKTPIRVLHRRNLATREKVLHSISAQILSEHVLQLQVETQAGTYVKEFVHGDFGRTVPDLGILLNTKADILELDVESIHLDWPPDHMSELHNKNSS